MRGQVSSFKVCKCRVGGKEVGASCPQLRRTDGSWNPAHGSWYGKAELPAGPDRKRVILKQGGFSTQDKLNAWFTEALALMAIPVEGADGHQARVEILDLVKEARRQRERLPAYDDIRRRYQTGAAFRPGTTGQYLLAWLERHRQEGNLAATTMQNYERTVERLFLPAFGDVLLDRLAQHHIVAVFAAIDSESDRIREARASTDLEVRAAVAGRVPATKSTKLRYLAVLRSALGMAVEEHLIVANPAAHIRFGKTTRKAGRTRAKLWTKERERAWREGYEARVAAEGSPGKMREFQLWRNTAARPGPVMVWTPAQLGQFLDAAEDDRLYPMFCLVGHCGLRRGEAVGLRWEDTDFESSSITIMNQIVQVGWKPLHSEPKTDASMATVRLDAQDVQALKTWRKQQLREHVAWGPAWADTGLVFTRENGQAYHPAHVTGRFERTAFEAGLPPIRLHDLRHGAATIALAGGADITAVSRMLRHSSIQITADIYADVLPELAAEVASKVVAMIPRKNRRSDAV